MTTDEMTTDDMPIQEWYKKLSQVPTANGTTLQRWEDLSDFERESVEEIRRRLAILIKASRRPKEERESRMVEWSDGWPKVMVMNGAGRVTSVELTSGRGRQTSDAIRLFTQTEEGAPVFLQSLMLPSFANVRTGLNLTYERGLWVHGNLSCLILEGLHQVEGRQKSWTWSGDTTLKMHSLPQGKQP